MYKILYIHIKIVFLLSFTKSFVYLRTFVRRRYMTRISMSIWLCQYERESTRKLSLSQSRTKYSAPVRLNI